MNYYQYQNIYYYFYFQPTFINYQLSPVIFYRGLTTRLEVKAAKASAAAALRNHGEELLQKNVGHDLNLHPTPRAGDRLQRRLPSAAVGVWPSRLVHRHRVQDHPVQGE